ncbi:MAG: trehalose-phosphatase, partial [Actinobacteria bacterium]|nr:trehalose-phosphatase [Actinomycetota bacterium]
MDVFAPLTADPPAAALFLDVDGVLAPIVERPEDARVPARTREELGRLAQSYGLVAAITGRTSAFAREIVGVGSLTYAGQHGLELDSRAEEWAPHVRAFAVEVAWDDVELKPLTAAFHFRSAPDESRARRALEPVAAAAIAAGLRARWGRMVLE